VTARPWAIVTGGGRGIGRAVTLELARNGWNVVAGYLRDDRSAADTAADAAALGARVVLHRGNVGSAGDRGALLQLAREHTPRLDGLVHCAGLGALSPALATRPARWQLAAETHFLAFVDLVSQARPLLGVGSGVVALTSLGTSRVTPGYASIATAKAALETSVRYLAAELAADGVTVNAVCGGPVETDSLRSFAFFAAVAEESRRRACGRIGQPEDIAPVVTFLLSPAARWIRGQIIVADGGFSLH
jgi:enoyl-[acyl-carrier protein] reductase III